MTVSPGGHPHQDRPNFTIADYLQMCRDGEAKFSMSEAARILGWSRAKLYRAIEASRIPEDQFEEILAEVTSISIGAVLSEWRRRTGTARVEIESCPHCGGELRRRVR